MNICCNNVEPVIHGGVDIGLVLIQHRSSAIEQVPVEQLRVQVPDLSDPVPHALLLPPQLHCHFLAQGGPHADHQVAGSVRQNILSRFHLLLIGRRWQYLAPVSRRLL